jgi:hypothetical protein
MSKNQTAIECPFNLDELYHLPMIELQDEAARLYNAHELSGNKSERGQLRTLYNHISYVVNTRLGFKCLKRLVVAGLFSSLVACGSADKANEAPDNAINKIDSAKVQVGTVYNAFGIKKPLFMKDYFQGLQKGDQVFMNGSFHVVDSIFANFIVQEVRHLCYFDQCPYIGITLSEYDNAHAAEIGSDSYYIDYLHLLYPSKTNAELENELFVNQANNQ